MTRKVQRHGANAGIVALEFALIGPVFFALVMGVFELAFLLYAQTALDYAAKEAARQLQTGQTAAVANSATQTAFQTFVFCPFLSPFLSCAGAVVTLQPVTNYQVVTPTKSVNAGTTGSLMLLQVTYTPSIPVWPLNVTTLVGTAAYLNEF